MGFQQSVSADVSCYQKRRHFGNPEIKSGYLGLNTA